MATLTIIEKINGSGEPIKYGQTININSEKLIGIDTKSLYIRTGFMQGTLFLSQKGNGSGGAGDICNLLKEDTTIEVNKKLFRRLVQYATKANAIINT